MGHNYWITTDRKHMIKDRDSKNINQTWGFETTMIKKLSGIIMLLCLALFSLTAVAQAASTFYDIQRVEVNDFEITGSTLDVERGDTIDIEVWIKGTLTSSPQVVPDVRVEAKIIGYEFGSISEISDIFSIEDENLYKKSLTLRIPDDIDASERYTLRIEVSDSINEEQVEFNLNIDEQRHSLNIFDVALNPSSTIQAGQPLFPSIVVENLGELKEENVRITVSVPQLGISSVNFIDELITQLQEEGRTFNLDEESSQRIDFLLRIPEDAPTGDYTLNIEVLYSRGHSIITTTRNFFVQGIEQATEIDTLINIDSTAKTAQQGEEISYKLMFANLGTERGIYSVQVDGLSWGQYRIEPGFITVAPDTSAEAFIYITPNENIDAKNYVSVVRVLLGKEIVNEFTLNTNVVSGEEASTTTSALKIALAVIFSVLVIALIVLGLVIAFRKIKTSEAEEPVSNIPEGQTYYYHPRK